MARLSKLWNSLQAELEKGQKGDDIMMKRPESQDQHAKDQARQLKAEAQQTSTAVEVAKEAIEKSRQVFTRTQLSD